MKRPADPRLDEVMQFLRRVTPLARTLVHPANDETLRVLREYLPAVTVEAYPSGTPVWTWKIPNRWQLVESRIEDAATGRLLWDGTSHPLATVNYSLPFDGEIGPRALAPHLHVSSTRPAAIPFVFRFYNRDWGFCVPAAVSRRILQRKRLRVRIVTDEAPGELKVGALSLPGESPKEFVLCTNICHPGIANDSISGAAAAIAIARHLMAIPARRYSYRILWLPETIGSVAYFAHHEELIGRAIGGLFIEMLGNRNSMCLQHTRHGNTYWDLLARATFRDSGLRFREAAFLESAANDEKVIDAPGVGIPTLSITRYPYPEYHTSDDNADLINPARMRESIDMVCRLIDRIEDDYVPAYRSKGPVCLSEHGLYPDWYRNPALKDRWLAFVKVMYALDRERSVEQLAAELGVAANIVRYWCDAFAAKGFLEKQPLRW
jgi:aminopeptidase-like protein